MGPSHFLLTLPPHVSPGGLAHAEVEFRHLAPPDDLRGTVLEAFASLVPDAQRDVHRDRAVLGKVRPQAKRLVRGDEGDLLLPREDDGTILATVVAGAVDADRQAVGADGELVRRILRFGELSEVHLPGRLREVDDRRSENGRSRHCAGKRHAKQRAAFWCHPIYCFHYGWHGLILFAWVGIIIP